MHTAIHNIFVFSHELAAQEFFDVIDAHQEITEEYKLDPDNFVGEAEINFRDKPHEFEEMEILYINEWGLNGNHVPDVYNY